MKTSQCRHAHAGAGCVRWRGPRSTALAPPCGRDRRVQRAPPRRLLGAWSGQDVEHLELTVAAGREEHEAITFHCRVTAGALRLSPEHDQARWAPLDRLLDEPLPADVRQSVARLLALRPSTPARGERGKRAA